MVALPTLTLGLPGWCLRAWAEADAPSLAAQADNPRVWRNMADAFPQPYSLQIAQHWVARGHVDFGGDNWAIACEGTAVGGCGLHRGAGGERCNVEIGYWLGEPYWGRGVVSQVVRVLTARAFALSGVTRVYAPVHADNPASMRVLQKNGFRREALLRRSACKGGQVIDRVLWARIDDEPEGDIRTAATTVEDRP